MNTVSKILKAQITLLVICFATSLTTITPAQAACGGHNQKVCPIFKKGGMCKSWLTNKRGVCRPCGGQNQTACPITKKGKACKRGLKWKLGKCVKPKQSVKKNLLKNAKNHAQRFKPMINTIANTLRRVGNKQMVRRLKAALKSKNPNRIRNVIQDMQTRAVLNALQKAGFRTLAVGVQSSIAIAGGYGRAPLYVSKTYFGGVILGIGSVGAGGAVGHGTTHLCPSRACIKVF